MDLSALPDKWFASVFADANWANTICYASEEKTGLHFYFQVDCRAGIDLHQHLKPQREKYGEVEPVRVVMQRKRGWFTAGSKFIAYLSSGECVGTFRSTCGGGSPGNFLEEVSAAYR